MTEKLSTGKQKLLEYLGGDYKVKDIDYRLFIYLDMGKYAIEIDGGKTIRSPYEVSVCMQTGRLHTVERHLHVKNDLPKVKGLLDDIQWRYANGILNRGLGSESLKIIAEATVGKMGIRPRSFCNWCLEALFEGTAGQYQFVNHMKDDKTFPKEARDRSRIIQYLEDIDAGDWAMIAFDGLWDKYEKLELIEL